MIIFVFLFLMKKKKIENLTKKIETEEKQSLESDSDIIQNINKSLNQPIQEKFCLSCGLKMTYYRHNSKYYCNYCKRYE